MVGLHSAVGIRSRCHKFEPNFGHITFFKIDRGIIYTVILPFPLIQESELLVKAKLYAQVLATGLNLPRKSASRLPDRLDMTLTVLTGT